jgi:hypothetical protein
MKKLLAILTLLMAFPLVLADSDDDKSKLKKSTSGTVVVVDAYGDTVGSVVGIWTEGAARVFMEIDKKDALVYLDLGQIGISFPPGPMLFFDNPGCTGQAYARPDHVGGGWLEPKVVIVPGFVPEGSDPSFERIPYYATAPEPDVYHPRSHLSPEGYCLPFDPPDAFVWPVEKIKACKFSYDLHACYPPPYELARQ